MNNIQTSSEYLANLCLEDEEDHAYTDKDLINATFIFSHFLGDIVRQSNQDIPQERRKQLAETGKAIRELIKVSTGKDMHVLVKAEIDKRLTLIKKL